MAIAYLKGEISDGDQKDFEVYLNDDPKHLEAFELLRSTWNAMDLVKTPEPSEAMDHAFFHMLQTELDKNWTCNKKVDN